MTTESKTRCRLMYVNKWHEKYYFVATGATHFSPGLEKTIHLISSTTTNAAKARVFESREDAELILARTGNSDRPRDSGEDYVGWSIEPV